MMEPRIARKDDVDVARLSALLEVLASANRLDILRQLREPRTASEIILHPPDPKPGENAERPISRQAVRQHLAKLVEIGVVVAQKGRRGSAPVEEYLASQQRVFAIAEEFRTLASLRPTLPPGVDRTMDGSLAGVKGAKAGVRLVLVHGLDEGRAFPLDVRDLSGERGWVVGRRRGVAVCLDYDPFVSAENAEVRWRDGRYRLEDLRSSRNGTLLNWERLPKGGSAELASGDVIGVGRSLLLFRKD